jgi:nitroimidazol reductase NimA-like FMN-containing flavoprotein (pyridoxamine 5'-phosphate oxidase superfamily)
MRVPTTDEDRPIEVLDEAECRSLLGTTGTGRLGFTDGALPAIVPFPFALQDGHVMIPAHRGSSIVRAVRGSVVVFAVDSYDAATDTGWSVTVVGPTRMVFDLEEVSALLQRCFPTWPPAPGRCFISVHPGLVRGWRMKESPAVPTSAAPDTEDAPPGR